MNTIIYDKFGKDCGNIILNYKKDLDNYNECLETYDKMFALLFEIKYDDSFVSPLSPLEYTYQLYNNETVFRVYDKLMLSDFLYFIKYYKGKVDKEILSFYKYKITIRDNYGNFNKDYFLTNKKYKLKNFLQLKYYDWLEIKTIRKRHNEITFNLHDNYIKKQKIYQKVCSSVYFWLKKKINKIH